MTFPEGGSVEVEISLDGGHGANRSNIFLFRPVAATHMSLLLPHSVREERLGLIN